PCRRILFQGPAQIVPGLSRHHHIGKNQVWWLPPYLRLSLLRVRGGNHVVAPDAEKLAHQPSDAGLVGHNENARRSPPREQITHGLIRSCFPPGSCPFSGTAGGGNSTHNQIVLPAESYRHFALFHRPCRVLNSTIKCKFLRFPDCSRQEFARNPCPPLLPCL